MTQDEIDRELGYVRMGEGLLVLRNVNIIIADICVNGDPMVGFDSATLFLISLLPLQIRSRLLELFNLHKLSPRTVIRIISGLFPLSQF